MNILCSRGQFVLAGAPCSAFDINQSYLTSIYMRHRFVQQPIQTLNLRPVATGTIPSTTEVDIIFEHMFENDATFFDFFSLPYDLTNIQLYLFSEITNLLYLADGLYFKQDILSQPDQSIASKRSIAFGAFDINPVP